MAADSNYKPIRLHISRLAGARVPRRIDCPISIKLSDVSVMNSQMGDTEKKGINDGFCCKSRL